MSGFGGWNTLEDALSFQRDIDRLFNQFRGDGSGRTGGAPWSAAIQINTTDDAWRIDVPMPGIDPKDVTIEAVGNVLTIRADRYEQSLTVPQFLNISNVTASHRHGMLVLTLPLEERVKPRRIQIETVKDDQKTFEDQKTDQRTLASVD